MVEFDTVPLRDAETVLEHSIRRFADEGWARSAMLCGSGRSVQIKLRAYLLRALLCSVLVKAPVFPNPPATRTLPFNSKVAV